MLHIGIKMSLKFTAISVSLCYIASLIFGLFNFFRYDWITFGSQSYGVLSLDPIVPFSYRAWEYIEFFPSMIFMDVSLAFSLGAFLFCVLATITVYKGKSLDKESEEHYPTSVVVLFSISVLCYVIGLAIWTHEICNGSFSKEHFSGEHCSYFAGWISTLFLLLCTIGSCFWRKFVLGKIIS